MASGNTKKKYNQALHLTRKFGALVCRGAGVCRGVQGCVQGCAGVCRGVPVTPVRSNYLK